MELNGREQDRVTIPLFDIPLIDSQEKRRLSYRTPKLEVKKGLYHVLFHFIVF